MVIIPEIIMCLLIIQEYSGEWGERTAYKGDTHWKLIEREMGNHKDKQIQIDKVKEKKKHNNNGTEKIMFLYRTILDMTLKIGSIYMVRNVHHFRFFCSRTCLGYLFPDGILLSVCNFGGWFFLISLASFTQNF